MTSQHFSGAAAPRHRWPLVILVIALAVAPVALVTAAGAEEMVHPGPPSVDGAQTALDTATTERSDAIARKGQAQLDLAATRREIAALDLEQVALAHELEIARRRVRVVTVRAYTGGAGARELDVLMDASDISDHLFRTELLTGNVVDTGEAIEEYEELRSQADAMVVDLVERIDGFQATIEQADRDVVLADARIERAEVELGAAQAAAAQNASGRADPGEGAWERLRFCESGGVYTTNTRNGFYGAYQFDLQT
jgi:multidrug resistance efflux pump